MIFNTFDSNYPYEDFIPEEKLPTSSGIQRLYRSSRCQFNESLSDEDNFNCIMYDNI